MNGDELALRPHGVIAPNERRVLQGHFATVVSTDVLGSCGASVGEELR